QSAIQPYGIVMSGPGVMNPNRRAFVFDPIGYALYQNVTSPFGAGVPTPPGIYSFPSNSYLQSGQFQPFTNASQLGMSVFMPRLRPQAFSGSGQPMLSTQIEEVFRFLDDLDFELPDSSDELPKQVGLKDLVDGTNYMKRYAKGNFSWFATLVPTSVDSASYRLSVAIVRERNSITIDTAVSPQSISGEKPIPVRSFNTFGGSGEIILDSPVDVDPYNLRPGHWFMVMNGVAGSMQPDPVTGIVPQYEWYRVTSVSQVRDSTGVLRGSVSVSGADWAAVLPNLGDANPDNDYQPVTQFGAAGTHAVIVPKVVSVYSKIVPIN
ncbi:MAG: hypothetical protein AAF497_00495, partial [Planctomycetota bacterium]